MLSTLKLLTLATLTTQVLSVHLCFYQKGNNNCNPNLPYRCCQNITPGNCCQNIWGTNFCGTLGALRLSSPSQRVDLFSKKDCRSNFDFCNAAPAHQRCCSRSPVQYIRAQEPEPNYPREGLQECSIMWTQDWDSGKELERVEEMKSDPAGLYVPPGGGGGGVRNGGGISRVRRGENGNGNGKGVKKAKCHVPTFASYTDDKGVKRQIVYEEFQDKAVTEYLLKQDWKSLARFKESKVDMGDAEWVDDGQTSNVGASANNQQQQQH